MMLAAPSAPMTATAAEQEKTGLGNYFIANYPPFSFWKPAHVPDALAAAVCHIHVRSSNNRFAAAHRL